MTENIIETVFAEVRAEYPYYPTTKPVTKSTILATLRAIREPTPAMKDAGLKAWRSEHQFVFTAMIDDLIAKIESSA